MYKLLMVKLLKSFIYVFGMYGKGEMKNDMMLLILLYVYNG